jgi:hypothetical protein
LLGGSSKSANEVANGKIEDGSESKEDTGEGGGGEEGAPLMTTSTVVVGGRTTALRRHTRRWRGGFDVGVGGEVLRAATVEEVVAAERVEAEDGAERVEGRE